ncbi:hypothetical protein [Lonepinella sp. BR2271]|uniref:hypothetical protein n=1 Tax=Lonepinella sp. BR2271 TaxID=3434550 RepID=UPI003F6DF6FA
MEKTAVSVPENSKATINQYGGYDNVDSLSPDQLEKLQATPRYKEVMTGLNNQIQSYQKQTDIAMETGDFSKIKPIPALTDEQKSFMTSTEIKGWDEMSKKLSELNAMVAKINERAEATNAKAEALKAQTGKVTEEDKKAASMEFMPGQFDSNFKRDADGRLVFDPKVDLSKLPDFKLPESNCYLLDGKLYNAPPCQDHKTTKIKIV